MPVRRGDVCHDGTADLMLALQGVFTVKSPIILELTIYERPTLSVRVRMIEL